MYGTLTGVRYSKITNLDGVNCSPAAWAAWSALCTYCDWQCTKRGLPIQSRAGTCYPTLAQLAARSHVSVRKIRYGIRELETLGYVRSEARMGAQSQYTLYPLGNAPTVEEAAERAVDTEEELRQYGLASIRGIINGLTGGNGGDEDENDSGTDEDEK